MPVALADQLKPVIGMVQPGGAIVGTRRLHGGMATQVHRVDTDGAFGRRVFVLKRYTSGSHDANVAERAHARLQRVRAAGLAAPRPVWSDRGEALGVPGLLTEYIAGRMAIAPALTTSGLRVTAEALASIHAVVGDEDLPTVWHRGRDWLARISPEWGGDPVGDPVAEFLSTADPADSRSGLCHGDFYPANLLWRRGRLEAVLDWDAARSGPSAFDVGYCRAHLALLGGQACADAFTRDYAAAAGHTVDDLAYWDVFAAALAVGRHPFWMRIYETGGVHLEYELVRPRLATFIDRAVSRGERW